jgi:hypothetical protein
VIFVDRSSISSDSAHGSFVKYLKPCGLQLLC